MTSLAPAGHRSKLTGLQTKRAVADGRQQQGKKIIMTADPGFPEVKEIHCEHALAFGQQTLRLVRSILSPRIRHQDNSSLRMTGAQLNRWHCPGLVHAQSPEHCLPAGLFLCVEPLRDGLRVFRPYQIAKAGSIVPLPLLTGVFARGKFWLARQILAQAQSEAV